MKKGKVTDEMRAKWKKRWEFLACNIDIYEKLSEEEESFIMYIGEYFPRGIDLMTHQATQLNEIYKKYQ